MTTFARVTIYTAVSCSLLLTPTAYPQGSLTPPAPPQPTMKTLDQLDGKLDAANAQVNQIAAKSEKRTPISSLPYNITSSGSYYFTGNLHFTATSGNAINVAAPGVTIDLMGFTLSSATAVTGSGIHIENVTGCTVKNGAVTGTTTVAITGLGAGMTWTVSPGGFSRGVGSTGGGSHRFIDLTVSRCRDAGIVAFNSTAVRCIASQNGGVGIQTSGTVTDCMASENAGANGGISAVLTTGSVAERNKFDGISGINAVNCVARSNGDGGFSLSGQASHCTAFNNGSVGIGAFAVISSTARLNVSHGIRVSGVAKDNTSHNNGDGGSGAGIYSAANGVRIEGNNCYENDWGIQTAAGINGFIVRNSCRSNSATATNVGASGNFDFDRATNTYGPVEQINGDMSVGQNATSAARASNPWANIQY